ncbi:hypothetical protein SUDANB174_02533 [Streptomyces sp. enrichment culture]
MNPPTAPRTPANHHDPVPPDQRSTTPPTAVPAPRRTDTTVTLKDGGTGR